MNHVRRAFISTDILYGSASSLGFVLDRHKATGTVEDDMTLRVVLESAVDPEDLFQARCDQLAEDLAYYRFGVTDIRIEQMAS